MIIADTSVWVAADRRPQGRLYEVLCGLIEADELALPLPVRLELSAGLARRNRRAFLHNLSGLSVVAPTEETWRLIEGWIAPAADKGQRFAVTDLLIAGLAHEIGALVWSLDADFERLEQLGLVQRYDAA